MGFAVVAVMLIALAGVLVVLLTRRRPDDWERSVERAEGWREALDGRPPTRRSARSTPVEPTDYRQPGVPENQQRH